MKHKRQSDLTTKVPARDPRVLLLALSFRCRDIYASIMAEHQFDVVVAQRVLKAVQDDVDMEKTETKATLAVLAVELEVQVTREKFVGPRNEHRNLSLTAQVRCKNKLR